MNQNKSYLATLRGAPYRHCFMSFPYDWYFIPDKTLPSFTIEFSDREPMIISWAGHTHDCKGETNVVLVSSKFLSANKVAENVQVIIRQLPPISLLSEVKFVTLLPEYWDEIALNSELAEEIMLNQFRIIKPNQIYPLWLEGGVIVYLKVLNISPPNVPYGCLMLDALVEISSPDDSTSKDLLKIKPLMHSNNEVNYMMKSKQYNIVRVLIYILNIFQYSHEKIQLYSHQELFCSLKPVPYYIDFRDKEIDQSFPNMLFYHPSLIIISCRHLRRTKYKDVKHFSSNVSVLRYPEQNTAQKLVDPAKEVCIQAIVMVWEKFKASFAHEAVIKEIDPVLRHRRCIVSLSLRAKLNLNDESLLCLETSNCKIGDKISTVKIMSFNSPAKDSLYVKDRFRSTFKNLTDICPVLLNNETPIWFSDNEKYILETKTSNAVFISKSILSHLDIEVELQTDKEFPLHSIIETYLKSFNLKADSEQSFECFHPVFETLLNCIKIDLDLNVDSHITFPQFLLMQGSKGSGKSCLIRSLIAKFRSHPFYIYCEVFDLKSLKGKKVDSIEKYFRQALERVKYHQPSLLVLEDLDSLVPSMSPTEERSQLRDYVNSVAHLINKLFSDLLENIRRNTTFSSERRDFIQVIGTCLSRSNVHPILSSPIGQNLFTKSINVPVLLKEEKYKLLKSLLNKFSKDFANDEMKSSNNEFDMNELLIHRNEIMNILDGLILPDIKKLALRIFLQAKSRWKSNNLFGDRCSNSSTFIIQMLDVREGSGNFISVATKALDSSTKPATTKKVGGMKEVKDALNEMVLFPSQFPHLIAQTTLRLRSGILLYGPSGCGKTLIANSLQHEPHLNFITVKGPEILSKYIGQSEKAVRDIFERAQNAKPCVIFFDEFESISPRRGMDNTGVTDRVVNQLLTQIDGVEGLSQVYIVATTSRPDLIDPALLRPGRLDKCIYCPIPNEEDRFEIITYLIEEIPVDSSVDIKELASVTNGFSGADLQSLFSTAQIIAARVSIGTSLYDCLTREPPKSESGSNGHESKIIYPGCFSEDNKSVVFISKKDIYEALKEVSPSISKDERLKYEEFYRVFSKHQKQSIVKPGRRETLA